MFNNLGTLKDDLKEYNASQFCKNPDIRKGIEKVGYLYFIVLSNMCKIGITANPTKRILTHINNVDDKFNVVYVSRLCSNYRTLETKFKKNFSKYVLRGDEWLDNSHIEDYVDFLNNLTYDAPIIKNIEINKEILLSDKFFNGQKVFTLSDIDKIFHKQEGTAKRNFQYHKSHFVLNTDYFEITTKEYNKLYHPTEKTIGNPNLKRYLFSEAGFLLLIKAFNDGLSWEMQRNLIYKYLISDV